MAVFFAWRFLFIGAFMLTNPAAALYDSSVVVDGSGTMVHNANSTPASCGAGVCSVGKWVAFYTNVPKDDCKKMCEAGRSKQLMSNGPIEKIYNLNCQGRFQDVVGGPVKPSIERKVSTINYRGTGGNWAGWPMRDQFYGVWEGTLTIKTKGTYYFWTVSDDGSQILIDGHVVVNNGGWHGMRWRHGARSLSVGDHSFKADFFEGGGGAGMQCFWGRTPNGRRAHIMKVGDGFKAPLTEKGYSFRQNGRFRKLPIVNPARAPSAIKTVDVINYPIVDPGRTGWGFGRWRSWFYVRWEGYIEIKVAGTYKFEINAKHGSRLFINGKQVTASRQGWHWWHAQKHSGDVALSVGRHAFWIEMYQGARKAGIIFKYQKPGGVLELVPKTMLFADAQPGKKYSLSNAPWNRKGACDAYSFSPTNACILYTKCDAVVDNTKDDTGLVCGDDLSGRTNFETCQYPPFNMTGIVLKP